MVRKEFKHLKADEKAIAERFVANGLLAGEYIYDVTLDVPDIKPPAWWTKKELDHWKYLRAKKIDLLVKQEDRHWIMEITPKLSKAAIGGVAVYRDLYQKQYKPNVPVFVGVICELDDPAYAPFAKERNIRVWVV